MDEDADCIKFRNYFQTFSSFNGKEYDEILVHLHNYATKYGLDEDDMCLVATVSFKQTLGLMRIRKLLKCLIPRRFCSDTTVKMILLQLCIHKDGSPLIIKQFLQWLIGVIEFSLVESNDEINNYYHLFIYFLKFEIIGIPAAKLVYFLTTPDDVTRRFTEDIFDLYRRSSHARHFAVLLYLFKCYRPDIVPESIPIYSANSAFGKMSDGILQSLLCAKTRIQTMNDIPSSVDNTAWNKFGIDDSISTGYTSITEIHTPNKDLNVSTAEPKCVLSLLNSPTGMYTIIFGTKITHERLSYQLYFVLYDAFLNRNMNVSYEERDKILGKIVILQNHLQQPIPVVSKFIAQYLMRWDGYEHQRNIFRIIEWMYVRSFTELKQCVLTYLLHIFKTNNVPLKCRILFCLGNFTLNIITTYVQHELQGLTSKLFDVEIQFSFPKFIKQLFVFLENLCLIGISMEPNNPAILNTIVIIHDNILKAGNRAGINFKISKTIPYTALFHSLPNALNGICKIINEFPDSVPKCVKQDYMDCLLNNNAFTPNTRKGSIFNNFDRSKYSINDLEKRMHLINHYAFFSYTYLINDKTNEGEAAEILFKMKREFKNIFNFLKQNV